eukprot:TRINITY_DN22888_c0_g1_i1.p1 TRINITY_DN22888_c0_g1~~TRINITY_DN22888_c0_g1_i1.p1  ORF type:complete len:402 (+),score=125.92 TRINITY_DN22888_c0_g1_i1:75-1280(+)
MGGDYGERRKHLPSLPPAWNSGLRIAAFLVLGLLNGRPVGALSLQQPVAVPGGAPAASPLASESAAAAGSLAPPGLEAAATGGSAVAGQPPADAVTMKTWVFLKEAMRQLRDEVQQIMLVKDDMGEMKDDLKGQVGMWHKAEQDMTAENTKLASDLQALRDKVAASKAQKEVDDIKAALEQEKHKTGEQWKKLKSEEEGRDMTRHFYQERARNLTTELQKLNATDRSEVAKRHEVQLQLETDAVALRLKSAELQDRLNSGKQAYELHQQQAQTKKAELERQLTAMRQALARLQKQLQETSKEAQQEQLAKAQADVDKMTVEMVRLAQDQSTVAAECTRLKKQRYDVACAETDKTQKRKEETRQLCQPVKGQLAALQMLLSECQASASAVAPPGMSPAAPAY